MATAETLLATHVVAIVEKLSLNIKEHARKALHADKSQNLAQPEEQAAAKEEATQRPDQADAKQEGPHRTEQADDECVRKFEAAIKATVCAEVKAKVLTELQVFASMQTDGGWQTLVNSPSEKAVHESPELAEKIVKLLTDSEFPGARESQEAVGIVDDKALDQLRTRLFQKNPFMDAYESPHFTPRQFKAEGECGMFRANPPSGVPTTKPTKPPTPPGLPAV